MIFDFGEWFLFVFMVFLGCFCDCFWLWNGGELVVVLGEIWMRFVCVCVCLGVGVVCVCIVVLVVVGVFVLWFFVCRLVFCVGLEVVGVWEECCWFVVNGDRGCFFGIVLVLYVIEVVIVGDFFLYCFLVCCVLVMLMWEWFSFKFNCVCSMLFVVCVEVKYVG